MIKPVAAVFALSLACSPVLAQDAPAPATNPEGVPNTNLSHKSGSLSDKLNSSNGVIRPEDNVDPGIRKPAPAEGSTPVIPPPGSPGGSQSVDPR
jgi:hypothetical protein